MPWKEVTVMSEKLRFIRLSQDQGTNFVTLCGEFGISRKTGYKYIKRFNEEGLKGLKERPRRPHTSPNQTPKKMEDLVLATRHLHPTWGGDKLRRYLQDQGLKNLPTEKTIDRILKRNGLITAEESEKHTAWKRFEHENPNDLWQMDFKGHFATGATRCYPLTILDDHSRFSVLIKACENQNKNTVKEQLIKVFREYGLPKRMTMDNGAPWGYSGEQMHTQLTAWLIHIGIYVSHSRPCHPQTQGKLERFHRTLKLELLSYYSFANLEEAQQGFDWWRKIYNEERPHAAINLEVPAKRYKRSQSSYPEKLPPVEYDSQLLVRKVQFGGLISLNGKEFRIGEAFYGHHVGLKEIEDDRMDVYFCNQKVNTLDLKYPYK